MWRFRLSGCRGDCWVRLELSSLTALTPARQSEKSVSRCVDDSVWIVKAQGRSCRMSLESLRGICHALGVIFDLVFFFRFLLPATTIGASC